MKLKLIIKKNKDGDFEGDNGKVSYAWYKAELADGQTIEFGSRDKSHVEGKDYELELEKTAKVDGSFKYKELVED